MDGSMSARPTGGAASDESDRSLTAVRQRARPVIYVVDREMRVRSSTETTDRSRLPAIVETVVRSSFERDRCDRDGFEALLDTQNVRVIAAVCGEPPLYFVVVERLRALDSIAVAVRNFDFTAREREVLRQLMIGSSNLEIAATLNIGERTVGDHIKAISLKTDAHNRSQITARVLGLI